jgi:hypothetical protein
MTRIKSKEDLLFRTRPNFSKKSKKGIYVLLRSINFRKAFFEHYTNLGTLNLKDCLRLIKKHFRPNENNYEVYRQAIKDLRKTFTVKLNTPPVRLRIAWDRKMKAIVIAIKSRQIQ